MSLRKASKSNINATSSLTNPGIGGLTPPLISYVFYTDSSYTNLDDTAVSLTGGYVRIIGSGFAPSFSLYLSGTQVNPINTTYVSPTEVRALLPASSMGTYSLMLFNANNFGILSPNSVFYSPFPTYGLPIAVVMNNGTAMSQQLGASGDAPLAYSIISGSLPTGISLSSSGLLSGTPTGYTSNQTFNFTIQVNDAQLQTITQAISITVQVGDMYLAYTTMLLSGDVSLQTSSFIADNSINNQQLTVVGDTKAQSFSPYQHGYYSYQFNASGSQWVSFPSGTNSGADLGTSDFTVECWVYMYSRVALYPTIFDHNSAPRLAIWAGHNSIDTTKYNVHINGTNISSTTSMVFNTWTHLAVVRSSNVIKLYINGVAEPTTFTYSTSLSGSTTAYIGGSAADAGNCGLNGHISNFRIVKGTALYTSTFTPSTTPLPTVTNTILLTGQSNKFSDSSLTNATMTPNTSPKVSSAHPFSTVYQSGTPYYSVSFNGSTDYFTTPSSTVYDVSTTNYWTAECWFNVKSVSGGITQYFIDSYQTGVNRFMLYAFDNTLYAQWISNAAGKTITATITANTWYHVAFVRNATYTLYVNGAVAGTNADAYSLASGAAPIRIGSGPTTGYANGVISNVRVVIGVAVYTGVFTPSTTPLTAIQSAGTNISAITAGQTVLLTCQDSTFKDNSTNNATLTLGTTTVKPVAVSPFTPSTYTSTQITTYGSAYFDGTGDYVTGTTDISCPGNFTFECWVFKLASSGADILKFGSEASGRVSIGIDSSNNFFYNIFGFANVNFGTVGNNAWTHIAMTRSGSTITSFINGIYSGTSTSAVTFGNTGGFTIGSSHNGYISDLRLIRGTALYTSNFVPQFTSPLSNVTNTQLLIFQTNRGHNNSTLIDNSNYNSLITRTGDVTSGTFTPYGDNWSNYFDGNGDYLSITGAPAALAMGTGSFTVECWIMPTTVGSQQTIFNICDTGASGFGAIRVDVLADKTVQWLMGDGGTWPVNVIIGTYTLGSWNHIAICRNATSVYFFVNGSQVGTTQTNSTSLYASGTTYIGLNSYGYHYNGYISNFRVIKGTALYTANFTPSTTPLLPTTSTSLLTCQSNRCIDNSFNNIPITRNGDTTVQKFSPFNTTTIPKYYSTYFDGQVSQSLSSTSTAFNLTSDFTVECWIYLTGDMSNAWSIFDARVNGQTAAAWTMGVGAAPYKISMWNGTSYTGTGTTVINKNIWYHVSMTRSGSALRFFVNGILDYYNASFGTGGMSPGTTSAVIGSKDISLAGYGTLGFISNLRIVNGTNVYNTSETTVGVSCFTPSTSPLTVVPNTVLLACQNNYSVDNSTSNFAITSSSTTIKSQPFGPFTVTPNTALTYSQATFGSSYYYDGTGDYLMLPAQALTSSLITGAFTWEAWVYPIGSSGQFYGPWNNNTGDPWGLSYNNSGLWSLSARIYFYHGNYGSNECARYSTTAMPTNQWVHLAWVRTDAGVISCYLNGVSLTLASYNSGLTWSDTYSYTTTTAAGIGGVSNYSSYNGYISGMRLIKGQALYTTGGFYPPTTPFSPTSNTVLLINGTTDSSTGIMDATRTADLETLGDAKVTNFSPYNGSYYSNYFDGTGDNLSIPANAAFNFTGDFTVEFWVFMNSINPGSSDDGWGGPTFVAMTNGGTAGTISGDLYIGLGRSSQNATPGIWTFSGVSGGNNFGNVSISYSSVAPVAGTWYHLAMCRTGTLVSAYINGTQVGTTTSSATFGSSTHALLVGAVDYTYMRYLNGYISNLRVVNGTGVYTGNFTVPTAPLSTTQSSGTNITAIAGTNTKLLTCQNNKFVDNSSGTLTVNKVGDAKVATQNPFQVNTGQSYYFDGTGDYLYSPYQSTNLFGTGDFTIEGWVYQSAAQVSQSGIFNFYNGSAYFVLHNNATSYSNLLTVWVDNYSAGLRILTSTTTLAIGQWYHFAITRTSGVWRLYVNGTQESTYTNSAEPTPSGSPLRVGYGNNAAFTGYIAEFRITKGVARPITVPTTPLLLK